MDNSKIGHHISEPFNKELEDIRNQVIIMGGLVEQQVEFAMHAFITGDVELAEEIIKQDHQVDTIQISLEQKCINALALRQPVAFDLRLLKSSMY